MIQRYIYGYDWLSTGQPVYTGSAFDVEARDRQHQAEPVVPFDKLLREQGREQFVLVTLEIIESEDHATAYTRAAERENWWMDKRQTWHEFGTGGMNFMRAFVQFDTEAARLAHQASVSSGLRTSWEDPNVRNRRLSAAARESVRARKSSAIVKSWEDPSVRQQRIEAIRESGKKVWADPEKRKRIIEGIKKTRSAQVSESWKNPETRAKRLASMRQPLKKNRIHLGTCFPFGANRCTCAA